MKGSRFVILILLFCYAGWLAAEQSMPADAPKLTVSKRGKEVAKCEGSGEELTKAFQLTKGKATFNVLNSVKERDPERKKGEEKFSVVLLDNERKYVDLVIGTFGHFDGARTIDIPKSGTYVLKVTASGKWSIQIEQ